MSKKTRIAIAGVGNLGWNLAKRLIEKEYNVRQLIGHKNQRTVKFAKRIDADLDEDLSKLKNKLDLLFICLPDDQILPFATQIEREDLAIVHCSGSTACLDLKSPTGVFYPFQTFTKYFPVDWNGVPIFIESANAELHGTLRKIAEDVSMNAMEVSFEQRQAIHIAGVFGANFTNHLLYMTKSLLDQHNVPFEVMKPLVEETLRKAFEHGPAGAQTGPARRNDLNVINHHLDVLKSDEVLSHFYQLFTESIQKEYSK